MGVAAGESLFSFESVHYMLSLVIPVKCGGGDQFTYTFLVAKERTDPDGNLFSFVIAYLCLQLASSNGPGSRATAAGNPSLFTHAWRDKASAGTGHNGSGGAQGFHGFKNF